MTHAELFRRWYDAETYNINEWSGDIRRDQRALHIEATEYAMDHPDVDCDVPPLNYGEDDE